MLGFRTKKDKQIDEMKEQLNEFKQLLLDQRAQEEERKEPEPKITPGNLEEIDDSELPQAYLVAKWDTEHETFKLDLNWNVPFLKNAMSLGVDGETDLEVAAFGILLFAKQIVEQDQERRANKKNTVQDIME